MCKVGRVQIVSSHIGGRAKISEAIALSTVTLFKNTTICMFFYRDTDKCYNFLWYGLVRSLKTDAFKQYDAHNITISLLRRMPKHSDSAWRLKAYYAFTMTVTVHV